MSVKSGIEFSPDVIAAALMNIYRKRVDVDTGLESHIYAAASDIFRSAVSSGVADAVESGAPVPDRAFIEALMNSADVFAAFRTHRMQNDIARMMTDERGELKPFSRFARDVQPYVSHQNRAWLRTEYNTAVIRAQQAARWRQFEAEKDIFPNLRWEESVSPNPGADHRVFWGTVRPVDDPFWSRHRPGDRWNCKCDLEATDEPVTAVPEAERKSDNPAPGLENNPGKDGKLFSRKHPYFPNSCAACPFNSKPKLFALVSDLVALKDCEKCKAMIEAIENGKNKTEQHERPPYFEDYRQINENVFASPYHGKNELKDNVRVAKFISKKIKNKVYLLPRLEQNNPKDIQLRKTHLPIGVFEGKNPDFLISGKLFDCKSMLGLRYYDYRYVKNAIENHIKKAKQQADNIILEIPSAVNRKYINDIIINFLNRSKKDREVWIIWKNKLIKIKKTPD